MPEEYLAPNVEFSAQAHRMKGHLRCFQTKSVFSWNTWNISNLLSLPFYILANHLIFLH